MVGQPAPINSKRLRWQLKTSSSNLVTKQTNKHMPPKTKNRWLLTGEVSMHVILYYPSTGTSTLCFKKKFTPRTFMITVWNENQFKQYLAEMYLTKFATKLYATNVRFICWLSLLQVSKWDSIFFKFNNGTIETSQFRQLLWSQYELLLPSLASYYLHDRSLLMTRHSIIFNFFILIRWAPNMRVPSCLVADDAFM